jgi:hypothetical protein
MLAGMKSSSLTCHLMAPAFTTGPGQDHHHQHLPSGWWWRGTGCCECKAPGCRHQVSEQGGLVTDNNNYSASSNDASCELCSCLCSGMSCTICWHPHLVPADMWSALLTGQGSVLRHYTTKYRHDVEHNLACVSGLCRLSDWQTIVVVSNEYPSGCNAPGYQPPGEGFGGYADTCEWMT